MSGAEFERRRRRRIRRIVLGCCAVVCLSIPMFAWGQGGPPPDAPEPTLADDLVLWMRSLVGILVGKYAGYAWGFAMALALLELAWTAYEVALQVRAGKDVSWLGIMLWQKLTAMGLLTAVMLGATTGGGPFVALKVIDSFEEAAQWGNGNRGIQPTVLIDDGAALGAEMRSAALRVGLMATLTLDGGLLFGSLVTEIAFYIIAGTLLVVLGTAYLLLGTAPIWIAGGYCRLTAGWFQGWVNLLFESGIRLFFALLSVFLISVFADQALAEVAEKLADKTYADSNLSSVIAVVSVVMAILALGVPNRVAGKLTLTFNWREFLVARVAGEGSA